MSKAIIKPYEELERRIYGYVLPGVPSHEGYVKVGETTRETWVRVCEQVGTVGLTPQLLFDKLARRSDGKWFRDRDLHRFYELHGITKAKLGAATEWFYFDGFPQRAEELADKYINLDYDEVQIDESISDYVLRSEQQEAVDVTLEYFNSGKEPREFLWNAKPRFGKTLTAYDFVRKIKAQNVLIVTNRPAIANSWFDDFQKFIAWQEPGMKFISETDALQGKALTRKEFIEFIHNTDNENIAQITFLSLQDLKGAKCFGGEYDKLEWIAGLKWDLLIIDEAHEGVDTQKTDVAFEKIERCFTLHLSGTPFKALANNKFREDQIFNWSYLDEQRAKKDWDYLRDGTNPYEDLPQLNLFTYQMSKMIEDEVSQGMTIDNGENVDYAFDLNEFFSADDTGTFKYEKSVRMFLDNLCSGHYPFSEGSHRHELQHTLWLLPRVNSAKALERLLKEHPVFKDYAVVLAAGDGVSIDHDLEQEATDFKKNEKSYSKVREAIRAAGENGRTITLSVGQLTTGVTIPEWCAVLMLNNIQSPSLYFQAAFRAQNPYVTTRGDKLYRKENAYVFDFAPERTLQLYDQFANSLSGTSPGAADREAGIKELINFFPVIGEDESGTMKELDPAEVLIIPTRIKSKEVVKRGFMSNLLFANISGIFSGHAQFKEILDKIRPEKNKRLLPHRDVLITDPMLDENGNVSVPKGLVINKTNDLFGPPIYRHIESTDIPSLSPLEVSRDIRKRFDAGFRELQSEFRLTNVQAGKVKEEVAADIEETVKKAVEAYRVEVGAITQEITERIGDARAKGDQAAVVEFETHLEMRKKEAARALADQLSHEIRTTIEAAVEKQMVKAEEEKKRTTEEDVRDHLRGFARTIPAFLMAYGDDSTTIDNFEINIDEATFEELTGITKDEFRKLRDGFEYVDDDGTTKRVPGLFDKVVFNASVREFFATKRRLSNYFDESFTEDIFDYIPPQKTNQIFTPKRVAKMMVDMIEKENPGIFSDSSIRFLDPYVKSGLYVAEVARRLFSGLKEQIPDSDERIKWILENQVYAIAPSNIIYNIVRNYIYPPNLAISTKNLAELDLMEHADSESDFNKKAIEAFGGVQMKFDVIVGNPPYQKPMDQTSDAPIYHLFMDCAYQLADKVCFITPARFLFNAGKTPKAWNEKMLNDRHLKVLFYEQDASKVFPGTSFAGGVAITYRDANKKLGPIRVFVGHSQLKSILDKVLHAEFTSFDRLVFAPESYRFTEKLHEENPDAKDKLSRGHMYDVVTNIFAKLPEVFFDTKPHDGKEYVQIVGRDNRERVYKWILRDYIRDHDNLSYYKVILPKSNGSGAIGETVPTPLIGDPILGLPLVGHTQSFISIGSFETEYEAVAALKYVKTKFARALLGTLKVTQDNKRDTWRNVPMQDFSIHSDIDWSKTIPEIDHQLYEKYKLSPVEIEFIEKHIKEME